MPPKPFSFTYFHKNTSANPLVSHTFKTKDLKPFRFIHFQKKVGVGYPDPTSNLKLPTSALLVFHRPLLPRGTEPEGSRVKLERRREMFRHISPIVAARIEMKFVRDAPRPQQIMKRLRPGIEAEIILRAAVEINLQSVRTRTVPHQRKWAVAFPESQIRRRAKHVAQDPRESQLLRIGLGKVRQLFHQRGAMRARRAEQFRMAKGQPQGPVAAHGNPRYPAILAPGSDAIAPLDLRQKFPHQKILVALAAIARVDVETSVSGRRDDEELAKLVLLAQVLDQVHAAGFQKDLLVFAQAVEKIKDGVAGRLLRVVSRRQKHAVRYRAAKNLAGKREALGAARGAGRWSRQSAKQKEKRCRNSPGAALIHTAGPRQGSAARRARPGTCLLPGSPPRRRRSLRGPSTTAPAKGQWRVNPAGADKNLCRASGRVR